MQRGPIAVQAGGKCHHKAAGLLLMHSLGGLCKGADMRHQKLHETVLFDMTEQS